MAAATQQSLYQSAAIFAGGLAIGAGALALSRSAFAPAHKPTKTTKRRLSNAARSVPAPTPAPAPASAPVEVSSNKVAPAATPAPAPAPAPTPTKKVEEASKPKPADAAAPEALPEPNEANRVKHTQTRLDLSLLESISQEEQALKANAQAWLTGIDSHTLTSTAAIDAIAYANSTAIFSYESATNAGFGAYSEAQAKEAAEKGWFQGRPKVFKMQLRSGAANAILGYLSPSGNSSAQPARVVSALTNSAGLIAMAPTLAAGLGPNSASKGDRLVIHVSAARQAHDDELAISNDYGSVLAAVSGLGDHFEVLLSSSRQEAVELAQYAYQSNKNVIHVFDGAFAGREVAPLNIPAKSDSISAPEGFSYTGSSQAKIVIVTPNGSHSQAARAVLVTLPPAARHNIGLLSVRTLRPWSDADLRRVLPQSVQTLHVLEELPEGASSGLLQEEIVSALFSDAFLAAAPKAVHPVRVAVGQSLNAAQWFALLNAVAASPSAAVPANKVIAEASTEHPNLLALAGASLVTFFDAETSATVQLASLVARTLRDRGEATKLRARLLSRFDNFESTGIVRSDIVLTGRSESSTDAPLELVGDENSAKILVVSDPTTVLKAYAPFQSLVRGGTVIVNVPGWDAAEFEAKLRAEDKRVLAEKSARLLLVDAAAVVEELNTKTANARGGKAKAGDSVVPAEVAAAVLLVAVLRAQLSSSGDALASFLQRVLGTAPVGVDGVAGLVAATERATKLLAFANAQWSAAEPISEAEANAAPRPTRIRYNGFHASQDTAAASQELAPVRSTWALPAWQKLFPEAYETEDALRPDLPEKNWVVEVTENRRLTPVDYDRNVFHMELSTKGTDLKYEVGEALGVHGWNDEAEVNEFIAWAGFDPEEVVTVPSLTNPGKHESRTVFQVLQQNLDIFGKPPKRFYEELGKLATSRDEARWLRFISSAEGSYTFKKLSEIETVTYADVLRMFPSARLPLDQLLTLVEPIKPRHYSIASAQAAVGESVHLLIVTVDWKTPSGSPRYGQCTRYLANLRPGAKVTVSLKPSVMKLPPIPTQPIIMAGLGTGAAPFRAFIQARAVQKAQGIDVGPLVYYFGSRYRSAEYLYGEELEAYTQDGVIAHMGLAFSRDTSKKVYIQHKIQQDGDLLTRYLAPEIEALAKAGGHAQLVVQSADDDIPDGEKGYFFVCGPTWPVPDIHEALVSAFVEKGWTKEQAEEKMENLKEQERYVLEVY